MKGWLFLILFLPGLTIGAKRDKKIDTKRMALEQTLEKLTKEYADQQYYLQEETEKRWANKQQMVAKKEENNSTLEQFQQRLERAYSDIARVREEVLAKESTLEQEREILQQKQSEKEYMIQAIAGKHDKESQSNLSSYPLNQDRRMAELERIDRSYTSSRYPLQLLKALISYTLKNINESGTIGIARRTFLLDSGKPLTAQVLRIGHCMAYAMPPDTLVYFLGTTGKVGKSSFEWYRITNPEISVPIRTSFPEWIKKMSLQGEIPIDVLQNKYSSSLISGERRTWKLRMKEFLRAGGPVLFPLAFIVLWACFLIFNKIFIYTLKHRRSKKFMTEAIIMLNDGNIEHARALANKKKGLIARILQTCLNHSTWKRSAAEKSVKELLLTEIPILEKHLDTLAVLAAAAPLMGLLGTVTGMIRMFEAITRFGTGDPKLLAGGISEALITTQVGLSIAIPLLLIHNYLRNRRNKIQSDMEMYAMRIFNRLWPEE